MPSKSQEKREAEQKKEEVAPEQDPPKTAREEREEQAASKKATIEKSTFAKILSVIPLASNEKEVYGKYPERAIPVIRKFFEEKTDQELFDLLSK